MSSTQEVFESEENVLLGENILLGDNVPSTSCDAVDDDAVALLEGDYDDDGDKGKNDNSYYNDEEFELDYSEDELLKEDINEKTCGEEKKEEEKIVGGKTNDKNENTVKEQNKIEISLKKEKVSTNFFGNTKNNVTEGRRRNNIEYNNKKHSRPSNHSNNKKRNYDKTLRYDTSKVILRTSFVPPKNCPPYQQNMMMNQGYQNSRRFNGLPMVNNGSFNGFPNVNPFGPPTPAPMMGMNRGMPNMIPNNPFGPNPGMSFPNKNMIGNMPYNHPRSMMPPIPTMSGMSMMNYNNQMVPQSSYHQANEFSGVAECGMKRSRYSSSRSTSPHSRRSRSRDSNSQRRRKKRKSSKKDKKSKTKESSRKRHTKSRSKSHSSERKRTKDDHRRKDRSKSPDKRKKDKNHKHKITRNVT